MVFSRQVIRHAMEIKGFRIPFSIIQSSDLIRCKRIDHKINIAIFLDKVTQIALEYLKGRPFPLRRIAFYFLLNRLSIETPSTLESYNILLYCVGGIFFDAGLAAAYYLR